MPRTMYLMNSLGHLTADWQEQNDALLLPEIEDLLAKGYLFFILKDGTQVPITSVADIPNRRVIIPDETLQRLYDMGVLRISGVTLADDAETTGEVARTAQAVAENDTVVTPPARGG